MILLKVENGTVVNAIVADSPIPGYIEGNGKIGDLYDGTTFTTPPKPLLPSPVEITMRQARLALLQSGLLDQVNTAVAAMPGAEGEAARIEWEFSSTVERNRPLVQGLAASLGLTSQQLDELFTLGASL